MFIAIMNLHKCLVRFLFDNAFHFSFFFFKKNFDLFIKEDKVLCCVGILTL